MKIKISINKILIFLELIIIYSGSTIVSYGRGGWITLVGVLILVMQFRTKLKLADIEKISWVICFYLLITAFFSYNTSTSLSFVQMFFFVTMFLNYNDALCEKNVGQFLAIGRVICKIMAISILLSVVIDGLIPNYFLFFISGNKNDAYARLMSELENGAYSGIIGEKAYAAFFMNVGIVLEEALYITKKNLNKKNYLWIVIYMVALMMTGKRTLFAVAFVEIALAIYFFEIKQKYAKVVMGLFIAIPAFLLVSVMIPQVNIVFQRISDGMDDSSLMGRTAFWEFCIEMFRNKPVIGQGFGCFNEMYRDNIHFTYQENNWNYHAHNIFYQTLGETGIIGFLLFCLLYIVSITKAVKIIKSNDITLFEKYVTFVSLGFQLLFILCGVTENTLYMNCQVFFYYYALMIICNIEKHRGRKGIK